jgi:protease-4
MRHHLIIFTFLVSLGSCYVNLELPISRDQPMEERVLGGSGETKIVLIELSGMMASDWISNVGSRRSSIDVDEVREQLVMAAMDPAVRAVLLHINSPGGEVTTADVLYHELKEFRNRSGKPIVVSIESIGASGGYYAALAGDEIWANPTAIVGSIGVVMVRFSAEGLLEKIGLQGEVLASGSTKQELALPLKSIGKESREILLRILNAHYDRFVSLVAENRQLSKENARKLADGSIFPAKEAQRLKLVDHVGYLKDALSAAQVRTGASSATVVAYQRPSSFQPSLLGSNTAEVNLIRVPDSLIPSSGFLYLWQP